jgi:glucose 1-dehydrogenase
MQNKPADNNINEIRKVVVVTGSGKNIGKAIAIEFGKAGYCVMINDFEQEEKLKSTAQEISQTIGDDNYNRVAYVVGDISEEQISISLIEETIKRFGRIDVLINNAAIAEKKAAAKKSSNQTISTTTSTAANPSYKQLSPYFTLEEYELADQSLKGSYLCIREAAKRMVVSNDVKEDEDATNGGSGIYSIINISSSYDSIPKPDADAYTSSMSGVDPFTSSRAEVKTLTKTVAFQLAEKGIRVNAIAPGLIATDSNNKQLLENEGKRKEKESKIPFHRVGQPEEIAKIALFLASDDASYITGSVIYADGGLSLPRHNYFIESEIEQD